MRNRIILLIILVLAGCAEAAPPPTPDPMKYYRAMLQPWAQADIETAETAAPLPRYHITAHLDEAGQELVGRLQLVIPASPPEVVFRLYPNLANYNGSMDVTAARINDKPVEIVSLAEGTAIRLSLPADLPAGAITISLAFTTHLSRNPYSDYTLFGWDGPILSLPGFYPVLAIRQGESWVLDQPPPHGDVLFNEMALYQLDIRLPADMKVAAGGVALNVIDEEEGNRTWQIVGGPLRDMTIIAGPFETLGEEAAGATVTAYYRSGHETTARLALAHAGAALRLYSDLYGPYPYSKLDVVEAPLNVYGMEYSGLVLIGEELYRPGQQEYLTFLVAHEVGHQWWYALVGNNPYRYPWLDEGLTEYSAFDYYRGVFGQSEAEKLLVGRWRIPFDVALNGGIDGAVDRPARAFDKSSYELLVYAKAALFFHAMREQLGEEAYLEMMQTYYAENRYQIVTPATLLATGERVSGQNLNRLAEEWLR